MSSISEVLIRVENNDVRAVQATLANPPYSAMRLWDKADNHGIFDGIETSATAALSTFVPTPGHTHAQNFVAMLKHMDMYAHTQYDPVSDD